MEDKNKKIPKIRNSKANRKFRVVRGNRKEQHTKFHIAEKYLGERFDFRYNSVANEVEIKRKSETEFQKLNDNNLYRELQKASINFSLQNLNSLLRSDFVEIYNPFEDYFHNLPQWAESEGDHIAKLSNFIEAKDQERFNRHFKKTLVRCVACSLNDRVFNKQAFILVHEKQSSGKSTFCRWLCPPTLKDYITENISTDKDSLISLTENFICNLDELEALHKTEITQLKSLFSKDKVKIRKPYDRTATTSFRRVNFFGSTNSIEFLNDETGSVRWLCLHINSINWNYKTEIDIDRVWAQAFFLYKNNFTYELTNSEIKENEMVNEKHTIISTEEELIIRYLSVSPKIDGGEFMTPTQIYSYLQVNSPIKLSQRIISKALSKHGFEKIQDRRPDSTYPLRGYFVKRNNSVTTSL